MAVVIDAVVIDAILLGQGDRRRQLHDFPVLADVWLELALRPGGMHDLLITPHRDVPASRVAGFIEQHTRDAPPGEGERMVAYLQGVVAARLDLEDLWSVIIPGTDWWHGMRRTRDREFGHTPPFDVKPKSESTRVEELNVQSDPQFPFELEQVLELLLQVEVARAVKPRAGSVDSDVRRHEDELDSRPSVVRQLARLGLIIGVLRAAEDAEGSPIGSLEELVQRLKGSEIARLGGHAIRESWVNYNHYGKREAEITAHGEQMQHKKLIWNISANRHAEYAIERSVPAIKADAARSLFSISCREIGWAILDSGIDETHPAFDDLSSPSGGPRRHRIRATYDFGDIRAILNKGNRKAATRAALAAKLAANRAAFAASNPTNAVAEIDRKLLALASNTNDELAIDWSLVEPLVKRENPITPKHPHGTHVAGILGGHLTTKDTATGAVTTQLAGVCPDINLYDFRVLGPDNEQTEFAVIAALQFIRYLNARNSFSIIDGVNMSLSIPHNVRNYACGRTPVCMEAEALTANGVVIVAAAGNRGYQRYRLADDTAFENYASSSITDPGNAEGVITVGATHRFWPHTYGVSFFSSRGPTGDGRLKPDLLAPGERIDSAVPGGATDVMDGTSMAAPHVSGAAALLMARHRELKGRPARVKKILCDTATDLGRERSFQGHGMVDVLRAIQSI
jgi:hypothetical protein